MRRLYFLSGKYSRGKIGCNSLMSYIVTDQEVLCRACRNCRMLPSAYRHGACQCRRLLVASIHASCFETDPSKIVFRVFHFKSSPLGLILTLSHTRPGAQHTIFSAPSTPSSCNRYASLQRFVRGKCVRTQWTFHPSYSMWSAPTFSMFRA